MNAVPLIDPFNVCWNVILRESKDFNGSFFNEGHCSILDSRDTNFNKVENRLAYIYKYGSFNIQFLEKCISNFLIEYSESETVFPLQDLKVCSLSNGPGLDIIGMICALYKSNKRLQCFPQLKAINLYDSWLNMYKTMVRSAYEVTSLKSYFEYFYIPSENITLIQSDIYATMSPEAESCISDSNVLLMVKVFISTKATPDVFAKTLKKIFSLLKPGALIFFVGSKHNTRNFSKDNTLSNSVKCIFGPQKVTLENLSLDEAVINTLSVKPQDSGYAYFIVWQKRDVDITQEITKRKRRRKKKKISETMADQKDSSNNIVASKFIDDTDAGSEVSFTSCSKLSDSLSDELKNYSCANVSTAPDEIKDANSEIEAHAQNLIQNNIIHSIDNITSVFDKINMHESYEEKNLKGMQQSAHLDNDSESNTLKNNIQMKEFETFLTNKIEMQTQKEVNPLINFSFEANLKPIEDPQNIISQNAMPEFVKGSISGDKVILNCTSTEESTTNEICQTNIFPSIVQQKISKKVSKNTPKKISKNIMQSAKDPTPLNVGNKNDKKEPKIHFQSSASSVNQSQKIEKNVTAFQETCFQNLNDRKNCDLQSLILHCDSLITSLEKMTADIRKSISLKNNDQSFIQKCCCAREACTKFRISHSCICSCCVCTVPTCCCRKSCNCSTVQNVCTNSFLYRSNIQEARGCSLETRKSADLSRPYITTQLQNEDIIQILSARKS